jgi:hypothetical protein
MAMIIPLAVLFTWIYNRSNRSLVPVVIVHVMVNTMFAYLLGPSIRAYGMPPFQFAVGFFFCAAIIVVMVAGTDLCRNSHLGPPLSDDGLPAKS